MSDKKDFKQLQLRFLSRLEDERKRISALDDSIAAQLTNILIAGSLGAILASVTFVKDIAPTPVAWTLWFLRVSWILFFVACCLGIVSLWSSRVAGKAHRNLLFKKEANGQDDALEKQCNKWNDVTRWTQYSGFASLAVGALLLLLFANSNLKSGGP